LAILFILFLAWVVLRVNETNKGIEPKSKRQLRRDKGRWGAR